MLLLLVQLQGWLQQQQRQQVKPAGSSSKPLLLRGHILLWHHVLFLQAGARAALSQTPAHW
jgi:hypothetical protein